MIEKLADKNSLILFSLLFFSGCATGPNYHSPETKVPAAWGEKLAVSDAAHQVPLSKWWTAFKDPILNKLIEKAVQENPDLRRAQARVREARAERGIATAGLLPVIDTSAFFERSRASKNAIAATQAAGTSPTAGTPGLENNLFQAGFDASWEIDVFGGVRRNIEASNADLAAGIEDRRDVLVSLLAEVARNYIELRSFQRRVIIAKNNLEAQQKTLELTHVRFKAGFSSALEVAQAQAQAQTTVSQIPLLENSVHRSVHMLSVLLAGEPNALAGELSDETPIPSSTPEVPIGLPSDLLRRRPDVRRAERQLAAATARIGVATADLFPKFSLTGSLGDESLKFHTLGNFDSRFWSMGPSVSWPILDLGKIRNNIGVQSAREEQAALVYEQAVLTSLREVEDALVSISGDRTSRQALEVAVQANQKAVSLSNQLYRQGRTSFLDVAQAERDLYVSEDALVQSDQNISSDLVALYKDLGGGWESETLASDTSLRGHAGSRVFN